MAEQDCAAILERYQRGELSCQVAIMQLLIESEDEQRVELWLQALVSERPNEKNLALHATFVRNRAGCAQLAAILRAEPPSRASGSLEQNLQHWQQLFDGLVEQSEELSVALYSLGSAEILASAAREIVALLDRRGLLAPHVRLLDLGCGIGRMEPLLAPLVAEIDALDLSPKMVEAARRRCAGFDNVRVAHTSGRDLSSFETASRELVLAIDSFPYVVAAGPALVDTIVAEAARVLVAGGHLAIFNFSYREELATDQAEVSELAARHDFRIEVCGEQPFRLWNGRLYLLRAARRGGARTDLPTGLARSRP
jgi:predicted TPR repeat methyltransferase